MGFQEENITVNTNNQEYTCENCESVWHINRDNDVVIIAEPFPHFDCPNCGHSIAV